MKIEKKKNSGPCTSIYGKSSVYSIFGYESMHRMLLKSIFISLCTSVTKVFKYILWLVDGKNSSVIIALVCHIASIEALQSRATHLWPRNHCHKWSVVQSSENALSIKRNSHARLHLCLQFYLSRICHDIDWVCWVEVYCEHFCFVIFHLSFLWGLYTDKW